MKSRSVPPKAYRLELTMVGGGVDNTAKESGAWAQRTRKKHARRGFSSHGQSSPGRAERRATFLLNEPPQARGSNELAANLSVPTNSRLPLQHYNRKQLLAAFVVQRRDS